MKDNKHMDCPMCPKLSDQITELKRQIIEDTPVIDAAFDYVEFRSYENEARLALSVRNHPDYQEQKDSE